MTTPDHHAAHEFERHRQAAYAAVTAGLANNPDEVAQLVEELVRHPMDAAGALLAMVQACQAMVTLRAAATGEKPHHLWIRWAEAVTIAGTDQALRAETPPTAAKPPRPRRRRCDARRPRRKPPRA